MQARGQDQEGQRAKVRAHGPEALRRQERRGDEGPQGGGGRATEDRLVHRAGGAELLGQHRAAVRLQGERSEFIAFTGWMSHLL